MSELGDDDQSTLYANCNIVETKRREDFENRTRSIEKQLFNNNKKSHTITQDMKTAHNNNAYNMHSNEDDKDDVMVTSSTQDFNPSTAAEWEKKPHRRCCFRRRFLLMLIVALLVAFVVLLSMMLNYSYKMKDNSRADSNNIVLAGKKAKLKLSGSSNDGCELEDGRKSFPDLDYAMFGYNVLRGYPLAIGHDPGLTHPIFRHDYNSGRHTADCRYHVPAGYILAPDVSCVTSFTSRVVKDNSQFVKSLSVSAEASGDGWGASFSASAEYKDKTSIMSASETVFVFSQAKCNYYFAMIDEVQPPQFDSSFLEMVKSIKTEQDSHHFFDYYGTHYLTYALFGAKFIYENKMTKSDYQKESQKTISVSLKASYSGIFSLNGGFGLTNDQKEMAKNFKEKVETSTITIGAPPPEDGKTMTWASTVKDNPVPVEYKLDSILNLFTERFMGETEIDYDSIRQTLEKGKLTYCSNLLHKGEVNTCKPTVAGYVLFKELFFGRNAFSVFKSSFDLCTQRCADSPDCQAASFNDNTYSCFLYRATNVSIFQVEISQQVKSVLFKESLKLLDKTLYLKNVRLPAEVSRETSGNAENSTRCFEQCQQDRVCFAYSYRDGDVKTNCLLFQEKDVVAESLKFEQNALTAIHINDDDLFF